MNNKEVMTKFIYMLMDYLPMRHIEDAVNFVSSGAVVVKDEMMMKRAEELADKMLSNFEPAKVDDELEKLFEIVYSHMQSYAKNKNMGEDPLEKINSMYPSENVREITKVLKKEIEDLQNNSDEKLYNDGDG